MMSQRIGPPHALGSSVLIFRPWKSDRSEWFDRVDKKGSPTHSIDEAKLLSLDTQDFGHQRVELGIDVEAMFLLKKMG
jgi:hypothetical protein